MLLSSREIFERKEEGIKYAAAATFMTFTIAARAIELSLCLLASLSNYVNEVIDKATEG